MKNIDNTKMEELDVKKNYTVKCLDILKVLNILDWMKFQHMKKDKMGKYLKFLQEQEEDIWAKPKELANKIAEYFENKIGLKRTSESTVGAPDRYSITFYDKKADNYIYSIDVEKDNPEIVYLTFNERKEISSISLADPKATYQTTSAREVKYKRRGIKMKRVEGYENAIKAIDKWFSKEW